jgi:hypothetical protein
MGKHALRYNGKAEAAEEFCSGSGYGILLLGRGLEHFTLWDQIGTRGAKSERVAVTL